MSEKERADGFEREAVILERGGGLREREGKIVSLKSEGKGGR